MPGPEMNEDKFRELCDAYLDCTLTPGQNETLSKILREDPLLRRLFVEYCSMDSGLKLGSGASSYEEIPSELADELGMAADCNIVENPAGRRFGLREWSAAAMLLLGLVLAVMLNREEPVQVVARVIHIEGEGRVNQGRILANGEELLAGDKLTMKTGLIELAYRESGVHVLATAPLSLEMDSTMQVSLTKGEMKLVVPPQGIGFVVDTPERKITDLGTSFVVKASETGSRVLVLDGRIAVNGRSDDERQLMSEGELAKFGRDGQVQVRMRSEQDPDIAELTLAPLTPSLESLIGKILGFEGKPAIPRQKAKQDVIAQQILPLLESGFQDRSCLNAMKMSPPLRFSGIAGSYRMFPERAGLQPYSPEFGWLAWYKGKVRPPMQGRYRFWGYADNHLLVAIDGEPVFEGSRRDSPFKELGIPRTDHPSFPCLNAMAGFASGSWFELGSDGCQLDIVFGEIKNHETSGLLLIEREGEIYEETYWGQPKWPVFLTEIPTEEGIAELEDLREQMESKLLGSFSVNDKALWNVRAPRE